MFPGQSQRGKGAQKPSAPDDDNRLLYRLKLQHVALLLLLFALFLYAYGRTLEGWYRLPYQTIADTLLTTGIVVLSFESFVRRETERRLSRIVRDAVEEQVGPLVERAAKTAFSEPWSLLNKLDKDSLDRVMSAGLTITLADENLASEVHSGLLTTIAKYEERWIDADFTVTFKRIRDHESAAVKNRYYQAYLGIRYHTLLNRISFPIWCVNSKEAFDSILWGNADFFYVYLQPATREFPEVSEIAFSVESIFVNGRRLETCISKILDQQRLLITCEDERLSSMQGQMVTVDATLKIKIPKRAHSVNLTVPFPTRGVSMVMNFGETEIRHVDVIDQFVTGLRPEIRLLPTLEQPSSIVVRSSEWVFPKGGVVFIWHLAQEQTTIFTELLSRPEGE